MAETTTITGLPDITTVAAGDTFPVVASGVTSEVTFGNLKTSLNIPATPDLSGYVETADLETVVHEATVTGDGSTTAFPITHNLDTWFVACVVAKAADGSTSITEGEDVTVVDGQVEVTSLNAATVTMDTAPPSGHVWRVLLVAWSKLAGIVGGGGTSDHGGLTGLGDDDHPQYALANGTRGSFEQAGSITAHNNAGHAHLLNPTVVTQSGGTITINTSTNRVFTVALTGNVTTWAITWPSTAAAAIRVVITAPDFDDTITWPSGWYWIGGVVGLEPGTNRRIVLDLQKIGSDIYASATPFEVVV